MKALGYIKAHHLHDFSIKEYDLPKPALQPLDLLIEVRAISVNPVDYKVRQSRNAPNENSPVILGWDASGVVVEMSKEVKGFKIGDEVFYAGDLLRSGSNAELQAVDYRLVGKKPKNINFSEAAALPLTSITAYEALIENKGPNLNEKSHVLIIGGAGGVGSMAIQILKAKTKAKIIATASRPETISWVKQLGAHYIINHQNDLKEELQKIGIQEVDVVFSTTHSDQYIPKLPEIIRPFGHFILIDDPKELNLKHFKQKSITTSWEFMFSKSMFNYHPEEQGCLLNEISSLVEKGAMRSTLQKEFKGFFAENLKAAHEILETGLGIGKIVVSR